MLALPMKGTDKKTDWAGPLTKYIRATYGKRQAEAHREQLSAVAELRTPWTSHHSNCIT